MQLTLIDKTQHYITKCFTRILDLIDCVCEKCVDFPKRKQTINYFLYQIEKNEKNGYEDDPVYDEWQLINLESSFSLSKGRKKKSWSTIPLNLYCYLEKMAFWVSAEGGKILEKTLGSGKMLFVLDKLTEWLGLRPRILSLDHPQLKSF